MHVLVRAQVRAYGLRRLSSEATCGLWILEGFREGFRCLGCFGGQYLIPWYIRADAFQNTPEPHDYNLQTIFVFFQNKTASELSIAFIRSTSCFGCHIASESTSVSTTFQLPSP